MCTVLCLLIYGGIPIRIVEDYLQEREEKTETGRCEKCLKDQEGADDESEMYQVSAF